MALRLYKNRNVARTDQRAVGKTLFADHRADALCDQLCLRLVRVEKDRFCTLLWLRRLFCQKQCDGRGNVVGGRQCFAADQIVVLRVTDAFRTCGKGVGADQIDKTDDVRVTPEVGGHEYAAAVRCGSCRTGRGR